MMGKVFKGCGCLSIGFFVLLVLVAIFSDDEEKTDTTDETVQKTEQTEKKDSVIVNEPLWLVVPKRCCMRRALVSVREALRSIFRSRAGSRVALS